MKPDTFIREDGQRGAVVDRIADADGTIHAVIEFPDGMRFEVPESLLPDATNGDGSVGHLHRRTVEAGGGRIIIPVIAEHLSVTKRQVPHTVVRVHKRVETHDEVIQASLRRQNVVVEHVPINQLVEGEPPAPRQEGEWTVIPIVEEVLVVEKRLMLVEEVRVARQETTVEEPKTVTLRREVVEVERLPADATTLPTEDASGEETPGDDVPPPAWGEPSKSGPAETAPATPTEETTDEKSPEAKASLAWE
jgi:uncharacterized protein (TIGR02271 family)